MKKRLFIVLLTSTIAITSSQVSFVFASSDSESSVEQTSDEETAFTFRDIPWWSAKSDVDKKLTSEGAEIQQAAFEDNILRMNGIDYTNTTIGKNRVDGGGIVGRYSGIKVAGYTPSNTQACYIYTLNDDGSINKDKDSAQFYFGWYTFEPYDYADGEGVYNDLLQKLQSLYGEGTDSNQIRLLLGGKNKDSKYVTLGYMAAGADEKLDTMQTAVDAEAVDQEAAEREKNKEDVSGL